MAVAMVATVVVVVVALLSLFFSFHPPILPLASLHIINQTATSSSSSSSWVFLGFFFLVGGFFYFLGPTTRVYVSFSGQKWVRCHMGMGWLAPSGVGGGGKLKSCVVLSWMSCHVIEDFGDRDDDHAFMVLLLMILLLLLAFVVWCGVCGVESSCRGDGTSDVVKENPFPRVRWFAFLAVCCPPCSCLLAKLCLLSLLTGTLFVDAVAATVVAVAASRYIIYLNYPFLFPPPPLSLSFSLSLSLSLFIFMWHATGHHHGFFYCCLLLFSVINWCCKKFAPWFIPVLAKTVKEDGGRVLS